MRACVARGTHVRPLSSTVVASTSRPPASISVSSLTSPLRELAHQRPSNSRNTSSARLRAGSLRRSAGGGQQSIGDKGTPQEARGETGSAARRGSRGAPGIRRVVFPLDAVLDPHGFLAFKRHQAHASDPLNLGRLRRPGVSTAASAAQRKRQAAAPLWTRTWRARHSRAGSAGAHLRRAARRASGSGLAASTAALRSRSRVRRAAAS